MINILLARNLQIHTFLYTLLVLKFSLSLGTSGWEIVGHVVLSPVGVQVSSALTAAVLHITTTADTADTASTAPLLTTDHSLSLIARVAGLV